MKNKIIPIALILLSLILTFCTKKVETITNPIHDGFYADPSIVKDQGIYYIYATIDPWGKDSLALLLSNDFKNWDLQQLNWPTKKACTSPTSGNAMVWAPSVVKASNGLYYMYVSVGSEVWVGVSETPSGSWKNAKPDNSPLVSRDVFPDYHMIDAECFIDTDGQAYLYWGSGLNWKNGHCFVVKLKEDMVTFDGDIKDITPPNYFEAPIMVKKDSTYYLMYSDGKVTNNTYKVRYSVGDTPFGPWIEGQNSPILSTSADSTTYSPGHHTVFKEGNQHYILYHRHSKKAIGESKELLRELCIDSLNFTEDGFIEKIKTVGVSKF
jgi:beta-xylosidase